MEVTWSLQQPVSAALSLFANHPSIKDLRSHSQVTRRLSSVYDICSLLFIFDCRLTDVSWLTPVYLLPACLCDALCLLFPAFIFIRQNSLIRLLTTCHVACQRVFLFLFGSSLAASYSGFFFFFFFSNTKAKTETGPNHILVEQICLSSSLNAHWSCMSVEGCRTPDGGAQVNDDTWYLSSLGTHKNTLPLKASASRACSCIEASQAGLLSHSALIAITSPSLQTSQMDKPSAAQHSHHWQLTSSPPMSPTFITLS